jgi:hypothetical protein
MPPSPSGCLICGADLEYLDEPLELECAYCRQKSMTTTRCVNGHYICDRCHRLDTEDLIEVICLRSSENDPFILTGRIFSSPAFRLHGPEHHFLVPAVLIAAFYNHTREPGKKERGIKNARHRAGMVKGGSCGLLGDCGAAVGAGIFVSIITGATPASCEEWRLANLMTARALEQIALHGGPRCCKRNTFLALKEAIRFISKEMGIRLPEPRDIYCQFSEGNRECLKERCPFFREP